MVFRSPSKRKVKAQEDEEPSAIFFGQKVSEAMSAEVSNDGPKEGAKPSQEGEANPTPPQGGGPFRNDGGRSGRGGPFGGRGGGRGGGGRGGPGGPPPPPHSLVGRPGFRRGGGGPFQGNRGNDRVPGSELLRTFLEARSVSSYLLRGSITGPIRIKRSQGNDAKDLLGSV